MPTPASQRESLPLVLFEDEHVLVINKPAGVNTHAPSPYAGEGIFDWLRHREPRWTRLAILHRLDKETSGVMVFGKTAMANRSLTDQFAQRTIRKKYVLLTDHTPPKNTWTVKSKLIRRGSKYVSVAQRRGGELAETQFTLLSTNPAGHSLIAAQPRTGRTHQIRVHAADSGVPILGDALYGGTAAPRICLHAQQLIFRHPVSGVEQVFTISTTFPKDFRLGLRQAVMDPALTDACRLVHGAADGAAYRGVYWDRFGDFLLLSSETELDCSRMLSSASLSAAPEPIAQACPGSVAAATSPPATGPALPWTQRFGVRGIYFKTLTRRIRGATAREVSPRHVFGEPAPESFSIRENGVRYEIRFSAGYSAGLFLDQRDNRRRILVNHIGPGFPVFLTGPAGATVLNTFAYTCGFSVCAALAGARTTSLDLSRKYLDWGRRNFVLNELGPSEHDFLYGDTLDWMRRLARKQRQFDLILLDPPTFSKSKQSGVFRAEKDYPKLVTAALPLLRPDGVLFASTNAATLKPEQFLDMVETPIRKARRPIRQRLYVPQPPDFPICRAEPAYLKTVWLRVQ